jgi:hypothetical protein
MRGEAKTAKRAKTAKFQAIFCRFCPFCFHGAVNCRWFYTGREGSLLFRPQRFDRVHARDPTRGEVTGRRRRRKYANSGYRVCERIQGADFE